ncbi:MAG TPA: 16S rRNA (adenine(1518)-N(6)/adenine(1519)-N(6))-dimethyltransferase RsmA [Candidatus Azoamicus sp. OHIO2]
MFFYSKYKKNLGQHALINKKIKNKIIAALNISNTDVIFEIGAGDGCISSSLIQFAKNVFLIELDITLSNILKKKFAFLSHVVVFNDDILTFNFNYIIKDHSKFRIFGNIPYNISTQIMLVLIRLSKHVEDIHLVVQKEFADKLCIKTHGFLSYVSFLRYYHYSFTRIFNITAGSFIPKPCVDSVFIKLKVKKKLYLLNFFLFKKFIKVIFKNRKKKIIVIVPKISILYKYFNISSRPDILLLKEYIRLFNLLYIIKTK